MYKRQLWACEKLPESRLLKILSGLMLLMMAAEVFYFVFRILRSIRAVENKISQLSREEDTDTAARLSEQNGTSELMEAIEIPVSYTHLGITTARAAESRYRKTGLRRFSPMRRTFLPGEHKNVTEIRPPQAVCTVSRAGFLLLNLLGNVII